jgi:hypothetical protein
MSSKLNFLEFMSEHSFWLSGHFLQMQPFWKSCPDTSFGYLDMSSEMKSLEILSGHDFWLSGHAF